MKIKKGKQTDKLSIAVIINELSREQLEILGKYFAQVSDWTSVLLVKQIPCFPIAFYQLREILLSEKQLHEEAKEALYQASNCFNVPLMRKVIQGTILMHVFQALPEIDQVIGHGLDKVRFFLGNQHPSFIGGVRRWIEEFDSDDKDMKASNVKETSEASRYENSFSSESIILDGSEELDKRNPTIVSSGAVPKNK